MPRQHLTLTANHLGASRDERLLFKPISFSLGSGHALLIEGPNGIGKTTLLRVMAGLLTPACGEFKSDLTKENVAYLGPQHAVKGLLTPLEYLRYFSVQTGNDVQDVLAKMNLTAFAHKPCASLSSGQKQRVGLMRIILSQCPLWILDEPLTALDGEGEKVFISLLQQHLTEGGLAIIASHQNIATHNLQKIRLEA